MYKIMAEGVVNSSKKIDDGTCNFSCYGQLLDQFLGRLHKFYSQRFLFRGTIIRRRFLETHVVDRPRTRAKEPLGAGSVLARRASGCEPLLEKNLEQLELAKKIPKLKTRRNFEQKRMAKTFTFQSLGSLLGLPYGLPR